MSKAVKPLGEDERAHWKDFSASFRRKAANKAEPLEDLLPVPDNRRAPIKAPSTAELLRRASGIDGSRQASGKFDEKVQEPPKP